MSAKKKPKAKVAVVEEGLTVGKPWGEIRSLVELGVPMTQVAKAYHIGYDSILHRRKLEKWSTPAEVSEKARQLMAEHVGDPNDQNPILTMRAQELVEKHLSLREVAHSMAVEGIKAMKESKRTPSTFFEAESLMRVADKAAGLDTGGPSDKGSGSGNTQNPGAPSAITVNFLTPVPQHQQPEPGPIVDVSEPQEP